MTGRWAPSWFGQGLLTRPSSATAVPDRLRGHLQTFGRPNGGVGRPSPNEGPNGGGRETLAGRSPKFLRPRVLLLFLKRRSRSGRRVGQDFKPRHVEEMVG